jgi:tripartite-type tricarboxylate transporter receptor subunit TctC
MSIKLIGAVVALGLTAGIATAQDYPTKEIQGIIQWGAGGSTDTVMRSITPHAEAALGGTVWCSGRDCIELCGGCRSRWV